MKMAQRQLICGLQRPVLALVVIVTTFSKIGDAQVNGTTPIVQYLSRTNSTFYSYFWTALQAGHLDDYLNQPGLNLTIFAPTNDAWIKRMPTLTTRNGITVQQLFSESNSAATQSLLQYHILNTPQRVSNFKDGAFLSTLSNLCSDAKTLSVSVQNSTVTLVTAGGTRPKLLDRGFLVGGQSIVYPVDDVLLPSVVTIPLSAALANYNQTSNNPYSPAIADKVSVLDKLQKDTANGAPAPIYLAPATPPTPGASSIVGSGTTGK